MLLHGLDCVDIIFNNHDVGRYKPSILLPLPLNNAKNIHTLEVLMPDNSRSRAA